MSFQGKFGLVTGGTHGIGFTLAQDLVRAGARLTLTGRDTERGMAAERALKGRARFVQCDVSKEDEVDALFKRIEVEEGTLHFAVNNAGVTAPRAPVLELDLRAWKTVLDVNLTGTAHSLKRELQLMGRQPGSSIVNVTSCAGVLAVADQAAYSVSKAALNCLTQVAAIENATDRDGRHAVRVNAVAPGPTVGGMNTAERLAANPDATQRKLAVTAMKRMADPKEIAEAILFLLSPRSSYITGTVLYVDGGYSSGKF
ncbi:MULTISPECIES: SDR family NAD(P)-dependent oxidoreductase [unclassified Paraburkholderia]|uniref:SDR family NAD(P)-dependent oxidoreductase n=1 Tax=unclassified Paraburkholderia TaxID=2615204 RepID=UPI0016095AC8|nr:MULTISPECIES: SDR family oxidoreductase [unclassified Paraburkholderia]MBB5409777.1 NAD(P)-dependent dehydrogenase (short-subunit alcohol dehydrogenase family) [Paraburkholderia sp. HC6.4b]MBB5451752.1 NAD(P)-dependent dehydrogenase (short-subunit alcohol dehydrogenase family) [Paraburkholderia sp. Kb1A]